MHYLRSLESRIICPQTVNLKRVICPKQKQPTSESFQKRGVPSELMLTTCRALYRGVLCDRDAFERWATEFDNILSIVENTMCILKTQTFVNFRQNDASSSVRLTLGIYPHLKARGHTEKNLLSLTRRYSVGLGEVGGKMPPSSIADRPNGMVSVWLSFTTKRCEWKAQEKD